jgi:hypothetical protein
MQGFHTRCEKNRTLKNEGCGTRLKPAALRFDLADLASQPRIESSAAKAVRHFEQPFVAAMDSLRSP